MQLTPELKAQLAEQKKNCVFCKLVSKEMPGNVVFEDAKSMAILDIYPAVKGHTLFMLKEHYPILPYVPPDEFHHFFWVVPLLAKAIKSAMVTLGLNVFIASGGVAGQQAPHVMMHLMPRDEGDGFFNFLLKKGTVTPEEQKKVLAYNLPLFMNDHFAKNPAPWHQGAGEQPAFLEKVYSSGAVLYEDEKLVCVLPAKGSVAGQVDIYPKAEEKDIAKLSSEDSVHVFATASMIASLLFEGLKAQGTNILLRSGRTDDHPEGRLCISVFPRVPEDSLKGMIWEAKQPQYDLDGIASKIKDKTWNVSYAKEIVKEEKKYVVTRPVIETISGPKKEERKLTHEEEIRLALEKVWNS